VFHAFFNEAQAAMKMQLKSSSRARKPKGHRGLANKMKEGTKAALMDHGSGGSGGLNEANSPNPPDPQSIQTFDNVDFHFLGVN
jgi:hypothetical protein